MTCVLRAMSDAGQRLLQFILAWTTPRLSGNYQPKKLRHRHFHSFRPPAEAVNCSYRSLARLLLAWIQCSDMHLQMSP